MRDAAIAGVGITPFDRAPAGSGSRLVDLGVRAGWAALTDAGVPLADPGIDAAYVATGYGGPLVGQRILAHLGLTGTPVVNVENACASSGTALAEAVWGVRTGRYRRVLAIGVDELSQLGGGTLPLAAGDPEVAQGLVMPAVYAMRAQRYRHEHGLTDEDLALVSVKSRRNASLNPEARFRTPVTVDEVLSSRMICTPLTLLQCSANSDGAAAALVTGADDVADLSARPIRVAASQLTSGRYATGPVDMTWMDITARALAAAYAEARVGPADLDVCEVHDAFTIAEIIYYEMLGLAPRGGGVELLRSGTGPPVNPGGGLLSRGHPIGATGLAQIVELTRQLRGDCGERQVPGDPTVALAHVTGGGIAGFENAACAVHILIDDLNP